MAKRKQNEQIAGKGSPAPAVAASPAEKGRKKRTASPGIQTSVSKGPLIIRGARVHNLKNISLEIPRNAFAVITGVSGSGKSSLAFDTIYAEGQRRYVESLSAYARQFLERMDKPDVDVIQGMAPAIAIEQKTNTRNPRSTVATTTEIYDYLRLLFARVGRTYCRVCGRLITRDSVATAVDRLRAEEEGAKMYIVFPMRRHKGHSTDEEIDSLKKRGFFRLIVEGEIVDLNESGAIRRADALGETLPVLVDRFVLRRDDRSSLNRLADSIQTAFVESDGYAEVYLLETKETIRFNQHFECPVDHTRYEEPEPHLFSFNSPIGACPKCQGFGRAVGIDMEAVVPDPGKTLREGAIVVWTTPKFTEHYRDMLRIAYDAGLPVNVPYSDLTPEQINIVMNGYGRTFDGINGFFRMVEKKTYKIQYRVLLSKYRGYTLCDMCGGSRLRAEALNVKVCGKHIGEVVKMTIERAEEFFRTIDLTEYEMNVGRRILEEIQKRLRYLVDVGLGYLTLDRLSNTLSGGESQRINLATSIGSSLVGSIYVLDEPSIGLHPLDNDRLIRILRRLRDIGNMVLVVEHDADMMRAADLIVDMGPQAGEHGGEVVFMGTYEAAMKDPKSLTGQYLKGTKKIPVPAVRRKPGRGSVRVLNAYQHNLRNIDVEIPLGMFVCVTGVSGSGKSTLLYDVVYRNLERRLHGEHSAKSHLGEAVGTVTSLTGWELLKDVVLIDQSPIGRSPRSNPITYIKAFDEIRELFAAQPLARRRKYSPATFSFNLPGGRCEECEGAGHVQVEMVFLADVFVPCEACGGTRYRRDVLDVRIQGNSIHDVLQWTVDEAISRFRHQPRLGTALWHLQQVGLGYLRLGQPATTLSGGEAQRLKIARELIQAGKREGRKLYILDEPTTGLHLDDVRVLIQVLDRLVDAGHTVVVIEHHLDVIKRADWVIDLGPEAGDAGGRVVAQGTPEAVAESPESHTGRYLRPTLPALSTAALAG